MTGGTAYVGTALLLGLPPVLAFGAIAAFCVGAGVFHGVAMRRSSHAVLIGWGVCGLAIMALAWAAFSIDAGRAAAIFTGLILPIWLAGGLLGLIVGLIRRAARK
ncbi:hypothetical protein [Roseovarius aquimarinus]|uniref:Transmembrane protein n=1 Tax=Roseovarius aquimarinus TaxID=1229156 RepID=A0ABW7I5U3_9RHOB